MNSLQAIAGICLPYNEIAAIGDGTREYIGPSALSEFLARRPRPKVFLTWENHDAPAICSDIELISLPYALGFKASLSPQVWSRIGTGLLQGHNYASVEFGPEFFLLSGHHKGKPINQVSRATIRHVTICSNPVYKGTCVWPIGDFTLPDDRTILARSRFTASEHCRLRAGRRARENWYAARKHALCYEGRTVV